jgi:hypothetical protein
MKETLQVLNQMVADGVIDGYVIGGAIAATYYLEPIDTDDLDVFFHVAVSAGGLITLSPLYEYLYKFGYEPQDETIEIAGWPVQFLPIFNPLLEEAYEQAVTITFHDVPTRIMQVEHLVAIMVQTGRPKDYARMLRFLEAEAVNVAVLEPILAQHGLSEPWQKFLKKFDINLRKE